MTVALELKCGICGPETLRITIKIINNYQLINN